jgi:hypothetical protein
MNAQGFGGLYVTGNTTNVHALSTGTELSGVLLTWVALSGVTAAHGDVSVTPSTSTGRLTLKPGAYEVVFECSVENNIVSGLSSEDVTVQDILQADIRQGNSSGTMTAITGTKSKVALLEGLPTMLRITALVEIAHAAAAATTPYNYISVWLTTAITGGTLSDVLISEARFYAKRLY